MRFRSNFEASFARSLVEDGIKFDYENTKIPFQPDIRMYNPDFYLSDYDLYIETKGRLTQEDRKKHLLVKKQNPSFDIRFFFINSSKKIYKGSKTTYAMWCERHGFQWAETKLPKEWLNG